MRQRLLPAVFLLALVALASLLSPGPVAAQDREAEPAAPAPLIPAGQRDIDLSSVVTSSTVFAPVPSTGVSIPFSSVSRICVLRFSAEARATAGDRLDIRSRRDGGACVVAGPEFFSQDATLQTRSVQHIWSVPAGAHTFNMCWRRAQLVADAAFDQVQLFFRTLTVECNTN